MRTARFQRGFPTKVSAARAAGNWTAAVAEQLIRHWRINHVTATELSRKRHRLLKIAVLVTTALTEVG